MTTGDGIFWAGICWLVTNCVGYSVNIWQWKSSRPQAKAYDNVDERLQKLEYMLDVRED